MHVKVIVITGSMGAGKTTVMAEASDLLAAAGIAHAAIDLDSLAIGHLPEAAWQDLACRNLAAVWESYARAGAERLLLAEAVESREGLERIRQAIPDSEVVVCRLTASRDAMEQRVFAREPGMLQASLVSRVAELDALLDAARLEDFSLVNEHTPVTATARALLVRAGWL
jgi:adenylylsulfate kinase